MKCLSVRFSPNCICFLKFVHSFFEARFLKTPFCFFFEMFARLFFLQNVFCCFWNCSLFTKLHLLFFLMFVLSCFEFEARFLKTEFCFFSKCLSVRFISKMHFDVFQNVCPFVFLQTAFAFFLKSLSIRSFWKVCHLVYSFIKYFLPKSYLKRVVEQKANVLSSFEFIARFLKTEFCFFSTVLRNVCPFVFLQTAFAFFEKIVHSFFLKSLSFSLFFCQIFSSQIISKTRKTCRRTKGNLLPLALLQESPQVFGIARLSEVRTIQISHKKNPILWVEKAEKQQIRDSCALYLYTYVYIYIYIYIYLVWLNFYKYPRETYIKTIRTAKYIYIYI